MNKILCAEALWDNDISQNRPSYRSLMELVRNETGCEIAYFTFNTAEELNHLMDMFGKSDYDIFYLASHMEGGYLKSGYRSQYRTDYVAISENNASNLKGRILHLAGCSSLLTSNIGNAKRFLRLTGLKVLSGYNIDTDTTESSAMDLLYLTRLMQIDVEEFQETLKTRYKQMAKLSGFKLYIAKEA